MSRTDGFARADIDASYYTDPKVKALARRIRDPWRTSALLAIHLAVVLESWRLGQRVTLDDAAPMWWTDDLDDVRAELIVAGLLDDESMVPVGAWDSWFRPALQRRRDFDIPRIVGGLISRGMTREEAIAEARRRTSTQALDPAIDLGSRAASHDPGTNQPTGRQATRPDLPTVTLARAREDAADVGSGQGADPPPRRCEACERVIDDDNWISSRLTGGRRLCLACFREAEVKAS